MRQIGSYQRQRSKRIGVLQINKDVGKKLLFEINFLAGYTTETHTFKKRRLFLGKSNVIIIIISPQKCQK